MICENCGEHYVEDKWCGCCCSDCYIGRMNGRTMKKFLELVNYVETNIKSNNISIETW